MWFFWKLIDDLTDLPWEIITAPSKIVRKTVEKIWEEMEKYDI